MHEEHANEQYFFDRPTLDRLAELVDRFDRPCLLCAPMLGRALHERGRDVATLDIDDRFADLPGYRRWDLYRPTAIDAEYDLILCDPPFFNVSLSQLFKAIRLLAQFDLTRPIAIGYLHRRAAAITSTFAPFGLKQTPMQLTYQTIQPGERNVINLFTNFDLPG